MRESQHDNLRGYAIKPQNAIKTPFKNHLISHFTKPQNPSPPQRSKTVLRIKITKCPTTDFPHDSKPMKPALCRFQNPCTQRKITKERQDVFQKRLKISKEKNKFPLLKGDISELYKKMSSKIEQNKPENRHRSPVLSFYKKKQSSTIILPNVESLEKCPKETAIQTNFKERQGVQNNPLLASSDKLMYGWDSFAQDSQLKTWSPKRLISRNRRQICLSRTINCNAHKPLSSQPSSKSQVDISNWIKTSQIQKFRGNFNQDLEHLQLDDTLPVQKEAKGVNMEAIRQYLPSHIVDEDPCLSQRVISILNGTSTLVRSLQPAQPKHRKPSDFLKFWGGIKGLGSYSKQSLRKTKNSKIHLPRSKSLNSVHSFLKPKSKKISIKNLKFLLLK